MIHSTCNPFIDPHHKFHYKFHKCNSPEKVKIESKNLLYHLYGLMVIIKREKVNEDRRRWGQLRKEKEKNYGVSYMISSPIHHIMTHSMYNSLIDPHHKLHNEFHK